MTAPTQLTWSIKGQGGEDIASDLDAFRQFTCLDTIAPGRYSFLLILSMFACWKAGTVDPNKVLHEITLLESGGLGVLKPPIQNRHHPLKGLWHKHYRQSGIASLAMNLRRGLNKYGLPFFEQQVAEAEAAGEERYLEVEDVHALVDDAVLGNLQRLREAQAMTGEWILFAIYEDKNYYLDISTHDKRLHEQVRKNIDAVSCKEFPWLADLLQNA